MYNYEEQREKIFTDDGQRMFLKIRGNAHDLIGTSGAVMMKNIIQDVSGDMWGRLACVDRLVELNEIVEIKQDTQRAAQHRIFVKAI